ncbi:Regulator of nonsense transcripts 1 [Colletotrichum fructicola]|nr:Regulator of nonsense transcripts 1 [Colletotrichum fructicola]KAF4935428.1 Regulator of nonsense transcripts 1 [Colletotrichum fructicola]KAF5488517.1 Regulator of nonsense transcripts 1 [Colletotrichum fructicola]
MSPETAAALPKIGDECRITFGKSVQTRIRAMGSVDSNDSVAICKHIVGGYRRAQSESGTGLVDVGQQDVVNSDIFQAVLETVLPGDADAQLTQYAKDIVSASASHDNQAFVTDLVARLKYMRLRLPSEVELSGSSSSSWQAMRTTPPERSSYQNAYFVVWVPQQNDIEPGRRPIPVKVIFPWATTTTTTTTTATTTTTDDKAEEQSIEDPRMEHRVLGIVVDEFDATAHMETKAVSAMATARKGSNLEVRWSYALQFNPAVLPQYHPMKCVNFHEQFPELKNLRFPDDEKPQRELLSRLRNVPGGIAMYTGGPGSGKTTFAALIAAAVTKGPSRERVVWTVHSNELCDDAVRFLKEKCGKDVRVGRLPYYRSMVDALGDHRLARDGNTVTSTTHWGNDVSNHINSFLSHASDTKGDLDMIRSPDSVAAKAINLATQHPDKFPDFWREMPGNVDWQKACRQIIVTAIDSFDVLVGTPFAMGQLKDTAQVVLPKRQAVEWKPALAIIDEAGRIPESQWWIPLVSFPDALVLTMGDTAQFKPLSISTNTAFEHARGRTEWLCVFGQQRSLSILKRAEMCGQVLAHLSNNRRNRGDIAVWANNNIYPGKMHIVYPLSIDPKAQIYQRFMRWMMDPSPNMGFSNTLVYDIRSTLSIKHGTGYINIGNRNCALWIAYNAFQYGLPNLRTTGKLAEIMILTPYSAQLHAYRDEIARMTSSGIIKSKITVRTIDNSMSAEADLVIFDSVRAKDISGFLNDRNRMAVASTRARGGAIMLANMEALDREKSRTEGDGTFNLYANFHRDRNLSVLTNKPWGKICRRCNRPCQESGHICAIRDRRCRFCKSDQHHERFCSRGKPARDYYYDGMHPKGKEPDRRLL